MSKRYIATEATHERIADALEILSKKNFGVKVNVPNTAPAHNALYRGYDLTEYFDSGEMSADLAEGNFLNIFPGDYIIKSVTVDGVTYDNVKWIVGDLDYKLHDAKTQNGNAGVPASFITEHHVIVFPEQPLGKSRMNANNNVTGGYLASEMWTVTLPKYAAGIKAAFGASHVLTHHEDLTNSVSNTLTTASGLGYKCVADNWYWQETTAVDVNLFHEVQIYGTSIMSSSALDIMDSPHQLAAFRLNPMLVRCKFWLRSIGGNNTYVAVFTHGTAYASDPPTTAATYGVRPYFLLY